MAISAGTVWRIRPSGNDANGGGFDPTVASPGTDYSQQNGPQVTFNGTTITATTSGASATITVSGYTVAATDPGNTLNITGGTNFTTGRYTIISRSGSTWTLDRNCTTGVGSGMTGRMGGGWQTLASGTSNIRNSSSIVVPGNIIYILGSGLPNPASYTYDYTGVNDLITANGSTTAGNVFLIGDPATPNGGFPTIQGNGLIIEAVCTVLKNLWFIPNGTSFSSYGMVSNLNGPTSVSCVNCVFDQFGYDIGATGTGNNNGVNLINCEITSSVSKRTTNSNFGITSAQSGALVYGCNIHDCIGPGIKIDYNASLCFSVISKNGNDGVTINKTTTNDAHFSVFNNTIDNNLGNGVTISTQADLNFITCYNNIISNHTAVGKFGMTVSAGTTASNDLVKQFVDFNTYYNNTTNYNAISAGPNDTATSTNPYVNEANNDFTLTSTFYNAGVTPAGNLPQYILGWNG